MAKARKRRADAATESGSSQWRSLTGWRPLAVLAVAVLIFYWIPLTDPSASIQWDAVDVHYSSQKYFADRVLKGELPFWTPYIFSGFPFLADIQVGAWYPLNWPFFLSGITPRAIQLEIALHAWLACVGAFLLLWRLVGNRWGALVGAIFYGFTGYFADHSSHVGIFCVAAVTPWLLLCFDLALERSTLRFTALAGLIGGSIVLIGHFQTALYSFTALGLFAIASVVADRRKFARAAATLAGILVLALCMSAIQTLPGFELTRLSMRNNADYSQLREQLLKPVSLLNVILPHGAELFSKVDPQANFYLYGGSLLLPLAALGLRKTSTRLLALLFIVLPIWYMFGPSAGLYRLGALLPGFHKVRAPVNSWFVVALGLSILAASGWTKILGTKLQRPLLTLAVVLIFADLYYNNSLTNPSAYARYPFDEIYENKEALAHRTIMPALPPLTRYDAPYQLTMFGPLNHPLDLRLETTYGYNPLELQSYLDYRGVMSRNVRLRQGLGAALYLNMDEKAAKPDPGALPRAYFARKILPAKDRADALRQLETLDPSQATIVTGEAPGPQPSPSGVASITDYREQAIRIHYKTPSSALLKLSVPWYPGWKATVDAKPCPIFQADYALMGIEVPAGEKDLLVEFHSNYFGIGAATSVASVLAALAVLWFTLRREEKPISNPAAIAQIQT